MEHTEYKTLETWDDVTQYMNRCNVPLSAVNAASTMSETHGDAFSKGQLCSKAWLIHTLETWGFLYESNICICGGWIGFLSAMLFSNAEPKHITSVDIDPTCQDIARQLNICEHNMNMFTALFDDMFNIDYSHYDMIINTSFEHIDPNTWVELMNDYTGFAVIQSNNFRDPVEHINCVDTVQELVDQLELSDVLYAGTMEFPHYKRFMVIGKYE